MAELIPGHFSRKVYSSSEFEKNLHGFWMSNASEDFAGEEIG